MKKLLLMTVLVCMQVYASAPARSSATVRGESEDLLDVETGYLPIKQKGEPVKPSPVKPSKEKLTKEVSSEFEFEEEEESEELIIKELIERFKEINTAFRLKKSQSEDLLRRIQSLNVEIEDQRKKIKKQNNEDADEIQILENKMRSLSEIEKEILAGSSVSKKERLERLKDEVTQTSARIDELRTSEKALRDQLVKISDRKRYMIQQQKNLDYELNQLESEKDYLEVEFGTVESLEKLLVN
ncbi:MAG: hypothetical protein WC747_03470 [Candidatus Babeliales bacterium]